MNQISARTTTYVLGIHYIFPVIGICACFVESNLSFEVPYISSQILTGLSDQYLENCIRLTN